MKSLLWKEWREQRTLFLINLATIILASLIFGFPGRMFVCFMIAAFTGTFSFTNENAKKTQEFLLSNPVSSAKIYWAKFISGLFLILVLFLTTLLLYNILLIFPHFIRKALSDDLSLLKQPHFCCFIIILIYSATLLTSLLIKRTVFALLCSWVVVFVAALFMLPLLIHLFSMVSIGQILSPTYFPLSIGKTSIPIGIKIYYSLVIFIMIAVFTISGLIIWQRAISKEANPTRVILQSIGTLIIISFVAQLIFTLTATIALHKEIGRVKTAGIPLTISEIIPAPIPEEKNAAVIYQQAFELTKIFTDKYPEESKLFFAIYNYQPIKDLTPEEKSKLRDLIMKDIDFIKLLQLIEKAVALPDCRFDIQYEKGAEAELPHLSEMRKLAKLMAARTYYLSEAKNYKEALKSAETCSKIANALINEPFFISQLVRFAINTIAINSMREILNSPKAISSQNYEMLLSEIENEQPELKLRGDIPGCASFFQKILDGEMKIQECWYYIEPEKMLETTGGQYLCGVHTEANFFQSLVARTYLSCLNRPAVQEDYRFYLSWTRRNFALLNMPYYQLKNKAALLDKELANHQKPGYIISSKFLPPSKYIYSSQARYVATLDSFKLALALKIYREEYGNYPDTLSPLAPEIISELPLDTFNGKNHIYRRDTSFPLRIIPELPLDPFTGKDYIYRREGKGFIVYSVGPNEKDDNGINDSKQKQDDISFKVTN